MSEEEKIRQIAEFRKALDGNPRARRTFDELTPGRRRQYVGWIATARRPETRDRRIARALELLEEGKALGMV